MAGSVLARGHRKRRAPLIFAVVVAPIVALCAYTYTNIRDGSSNVKLRDAVVKIHLTRRYGDILVTQGGLTLYTYDLDTRNHSNCIAFCLQIWPPLVVPSGVVPFGHAVSHLGTITRTGGLQQVTYRGLPLYIFAFDHVPGRISGVGDGWSVVRISKQPA